MVTSPPYWGLRNYGVPGQIGLEPTLKEYIENMVGICGEIRRVMKPTGCFWLNVGDSYAGPNNGYSGDERPSNAGSLSSKNEGQRGAGQVRRLSGSSKS